MKNILLVMVLVFLSCSEDKKETSSVVVIRVYKGICGFEHSYLVGDSKEHSVFHSNDSYNVGDTIKLNN